MNGLMVEVEPTYKRRGKTCLFTFRLTWNVPLKDSEGEKYTESWHWAYLAWDGVDWQTGVAPDGGAQARYSHNSYPPPREPEMDELRLALHNTVVERRALKSMGVAK